MKKKAIGTALLAAAFAAGILAGCGSSTSETTTAAATTAGTAAAGTTAAGTAAAGTAAGSGTAAEETTAAEASLTKFVVGASPAPHAEILNAAKPIMAKKGYDLVIQEYTDYVIPNRALQDGDLDANYFQHKPYLDSFNQQNGTNLVSAGVVHYEPFGIYAGKTTDLSALPDKATVLVPNDVTNEARALLLLESQGLLKLKEGAGLNATRNDIAENPKNLKIEELEAAQIPRALPDCDIAVINGNYAIAAGLKVSDALATEDNDSLAATTYANIVAVRAGDENSAGVKALMEALTSPEVKQFIENTYQGAVVPMF